MYFTYILENSEGKHYIGSCSKIELRLKQHNQNSVKSTKNRGPYKLIYKEEFGTKFEARKRENQLKSYKSPGYLRRVLNINPDPIV